MAKLEAVEGIGQAFAALLRKAGVGSTDGLLAAAAAARDRQELARQTGIAEAKILEWVNRVDLFRIKGVGEEYSDLLEAAGVDSVPELARRNAANLAQKVAEVNGAKKLVRRLPTENQLADWVAQAKDLPKVVTH
ncbi:MAG: DUF4332 domain-containing protein [Candidatus Promineifilaceae bacterium]